MKIIRTLKPGDPNVIYYSPTVRYAYGSFYHNNGDGLFVLDFYHDDDDLIGTPTITEEEALESYSKIYDPKNFYDLYS